MILSHRIEGDPAGLPIVMIHPLGADQSIWDECRQHFGPGVLTVSCDLRGSGASPDLEEPLTVERTAADIEELRRHLNLEKIVVLGCAVGAMAAAVYASQQADATLALIMSNPGFQITKEGQENLRQRAELVRRTGMSALLPQAIENAFVGYMDTERRRAYEAKFISQKAGNYAYAAIGAADADLSGYGSGITCPVLLTPGRNDRLFGAQHTHQVAGMIKHSDVVEFPEGAHFIPYQQPKDFGAVVSSFLDKHGLR